MLGRASAIKLGDAKRSACILNVSCERMLEKTLPLTDRRRLCFTAPAVITLLGHAVIAEDN
jgi:hypothetical protein